MIVEWNTHVFSADTETYPFHPDATYTPDPSRLADDPLAEYRASMDERGVDRAVLVHPEPYGDDHGLVLDCVADDPERFRATCLFYPTDPDAPEKLRTLVDDHGDAIVALRFHAHRGKESYLDGFDDPGVRALWDAAADCGLAIELHVGPSYARGAAARIREHPDAPVVIDHLAEPHLGDAVEYGDVLALAEHDNVFMKLSGLNHFSDDAPLYEDARPFTRWVVDAFGPERLLWGSGPPEIVDAHLPEYSEAERDRVKGENAYELAWD